jgi:hypothetical protein
MEVLADARRLISEARSDHLTKLYRSGQQRVYFVECGHGGPIKIGVAIDPAKRLNAMQMHSPHEMIIVGTCAGARELEQALHAEFAAYRIRGEWFERTENLMHRVQALCEWSAEYIVYQARKKKGV